MNLKDKVVLITGSSSGIGKAAALKFAQEGAKVVVHCKSDIKNAEKVVKEIEKSGGEASYFTADISDPQDVKGLFSEIVNKYGTVDVLINNAGLAHAKPFFEITQEFLVTEYSLNCFGTIYCCQEAAKIMLKNEHGGKIIINSSTGAITGFTSVIAYTTARAAILSLTKSLAKLLAPKITVNAVAPGYTSTRYWNTFLEDTKKQVIEETLLKKWVTPEEIAETYLYLAKNDGITGQTIVVDAGYTVNI